MRGSAVRLIIRPAFLSGLLALLMVLAAWLWVTQTFDRPGPHSDDAVVTIAAGSGHQSSLLQDFKTL